MRGTEGVKLGRCEGETRNGVIKPNTLCVKFCRPPCAYAFRLL